MTFQVSALAGRLSQVRKGALTLAAGAVLGLSSFAASAVDVTFTGSTQGCFGVACVPTNTASLPPGLSFEGASFSGTTSSGFLALGGSTNSLGYFTLTGDPGNYNGNVFDLLVTFTAPVGLSPNPVLFSTTVSGSVTANGQGGVFVIFDNSPQNLTFGTGGSAVFYMNNVSLNPGDDNEISLSGRLVSVTPGQTGVVPEPETYALFMAGLAAVGFMARRRRKS